MSDLHDPLLVRVEVKPSPDLSLDKFPQLLDQKTILLSEQCINVIDLHESAEIPEGAVDLFRTSPAAVVSILPHSNGTLTFATSSGAIYSVNQDLRLVHIISESLPEKLFKLYQPKSESYIAAHLDSPNILVYRDGHMHILQAPEVVQKLAVSERLIASSDKSFQITFWEVSDFSLFARFSGHTKDVKCLTFMNTREELISTSTDKTIQVWNRDGNLKVFHGHVAEIQTAVSSLDDEYVMSGGNDNTVKIWDAENCSLEASLRGHQDNVTQVRVVNKDHFVSLGDLSVIVWSLSSKSLVAIMRGHTCSPTSVAVDSGFLFSASSENSVRMWEIGSFKEVAVFEGHKGGVNTLAYLQGGLYSGSEDKTIRKWQTNESGLAHTLEGHEEWVLGVAISKDRQFILSGGGDKLIFVWKKGLEKEWLLFHNIDHQL